MSSVVTTFPVRKDQVGFYAPYDNPTNQSVTVNDHIQYSLWSDTQVKNKNPRYAEQIKAGIDATTPYHRSDSSLSIQPALARAVSKQKNYIVWGSMSWPGAIPSRVQTNTVVRDQALARVKRRIASLEENFQTLIPLAEIREVHGLVGQMADFTTDMVKAVINLKRSKGKSVLRLVQQRYLMWSFGIAPMIRDMQDLGSSIWAYLTKGDVRDRVQGTAGKDWVDVGNGVATGLNYHNLVYGYEAYHRLTYRYIAGWKFLLRSSNDYSLLAHLGLNSWGAVVPALWETTAYSWIADYFTTIGDFLEDTFTGSAGSSIYVVECRKYQYRVINTYKYEKSDPLEPSWWDYNRPGKAVLDYWEFTRTPMSALPARTLRWKTTDEIGKHAVSKLLNLLALLQGRRKPKQDLLSPRYRVHPGGLEGY